MRELARRILKLEQQAPDMEIEIPPLPPPGADEEELTHAVHEAFQQFQAHPHQPGRFLHLIQIAQRFGITSRHGAEKFLEEPIKHNRLAD